MEPELVLDAGATLGECPSWDPTTSTLTWVDITRGVVHRFDPVTGDDRSWQVGMAVGAAATCASGRVAVAAATGFGSLDPETGALEWVATVEPIGQGTTMNDGGTDPAGRFWAGTKDVRGRDPIGSLYRWRPGVPPERVLTGLTVSNGLAWTVDASMMYLIDSPTHGVDVFDHDPHPAGSRVGGAWSTCPGHGGPGSPALQACPRTERNDRHTQWSVPSIKGV